MNPKSIQFICDSRRQVRPLNMQRLVALPPGRLKYNLGGHTMYCRNCGNEMNNEAAVCVKCGVPAGKGDKFCPNCGAETSPEAVMCVACGAALAAKEPEKSEKSKLVAGLLGIFLGGWGIHNFYLGFTKKAVIQIIVSVVTCGIGSIWGLIDAILILMAKEGYNKDAEGKLLKD